MAACAWPRDLLGFGFAPLPIALDRKYPNASTSLAWQYVFPSSWRRANTQSHHVRWHVSDNTIQPAFKVALQSANIHKFASVHTLRHSFATAGTFQFAEEFPAYRNIDDVRSAPVQRTCSHVFDAFLDHCVSLQQKGGMEAVTIASYEKILNGVWRSAIGQRNFLHVTHSELVRIADSHVWSRKTYNNAISALRVAFEFGFRDHPQYHRRN